MRPILFSPAMSTALLAGTKTQTRRIIAPQPDAIETYNYASGPRAGKPYEVLRCYDPPAKFKPCASGWSVDCPGPFKIPGKPGDKLWVRETYYQRGHWEPVPGARTKGDRQKWAFIPADATVLFDSPSAYRKGRHHLDPHTIAWHKRLARFMPRAYSRTTLEITAIRAERLQDISNEDAEEEGVKPIADVVPPPPWMSTAPDTVGIVQYLDFITNYRALWESLHGPASWQENPFVWVITFKKI